MKVIDRLLYNSNTYYIVVFIMLCIGNIYNAQSKSVNEIVQSIAKTSFPERNFYVSELVSYCNTLLILVLL